MTFYLGTHHPAWLEQTAVPLFLSHRTLAGRRSLPRARGPWALDSGGFSELSMHGTWTVPAARYVDDVRRFVREIGGLRWAAIQDWMCEPVMLAKTGLSIAEHQARTVSSLLELRALAPDLRSGRRDASRSRSTVFGVRMIATGRILPPATYQRALVAFVSTLTSTDTEHARTWRGPHPGDEIATTDEGDIVCQLCGAVLHEERDSGRALGGDGYCMREAERAAAARDAETAVAA